MSADRWADIERLCHAALEREPAARAAFLDEACAADADLRREVESLLAQQSRAEGFLDVPVVDHGDAGTADNARTALPRASLPHGTRLGPYEVDTLIGAGGMGEVYRARDTRLGRIVALKVLPESLAADSDRRRRFEHEARAASALNHPHICTVYDVGADVPALAESHSPNPESRTSNPVSFLVMEHLEGETLAGRIARGPLPITNVLEYGAQIAEALAAAHGHGIVHRDLKPANVMLTGGGTGSSGARRRHARDVKLLDFGLAKLRSPGGPDLVLRASGLTADGAAAPAPASVTTPGQIVGTLPYMAPEQIEGREADARTDIWALGAMLHEMITGARAFQGASSASLMAAILEHEPAPLMATQPLVPPALDRLIRKCLAKDPDQRWQSARDLADELKWLCELCATGAAATARMDRPRRSWLGPAAVMAGLVAAAGVGAGVMSRMRPAAPLSPLAGLSLEVRPADEINAGGYSTGQDLITPGGAGTAFAWTPDGRALVFVGRRAGSRQLFLRRLDAPEATPIPNTENAQVPAVSADGQWVAFWAGHSIKKVRLAGGPAQDVVSGIANTPGGMAWSDRGDLFYGRRTIWKVSPHQQPESVTITENCRHLMPWPLPGGRALLYTARKRLWTWGDEQVMAQPLPSGPPKVLLEDAADARYLPTGHLVFLRRGTLYAVPFDAESLEVGGEAVAVLGMVAQAVSAWHVNDITGAGQFAVSSAGTLAWLRSSTDALPPWRAVVVDRAGSVVPLPVPGQQGREADVVESHVSSDGGRLALQITTSRELGVWMYDLKRQTLRPVKRDGEAQWLAWSPDGRLFFQWLKDGRRVLATLPADADENTPPHVYEVGTGGVAPGSFTPDGRLIAVRGDREIVIVTMRDGGRASVEPLHDTRQAEAWPVLSPDGRWLAYGASLSDTTDPTVRPEIYVRPFPGPGGRAVPVSVGGGMAVAWNPNGRELFYVARRREPQGKSSMMSVDFTPGDPPTLGQPRWLFNYDGDETCFAAQPVNCYSVAPDGRHFYTVAGPRPPSPPAVRHINIIHNWFEELKAKVPAGAK